MDAIRQRHGLDSTQLKIIAVVLMVLDHVHEMFHPVGAPIWLKWFGRPVFILFFFTAVEGFYHTRSKGKYLWRTLLASWAVIIGSAIISTILPNENVALVNNAFMTFFVVAVYMLSYDKLLESIKERSLWKFTQAALLFAAPIATSFIPGWALSQTVTLFSDGKISFSIFRVLIILTTMIPGALTMEGGFILGSIALVFYILRRWRWAQVGALAAYSVFYFFAAKNDPTRQWLMVLAAIPILLYNGRKGRGMKTFFYVFYPAHIWILYIISTLFTHPSPLP